MRLVLKRKMFDVKTHGGEIPVGTELELIEIGGGHYRTSIELEGIDVMNWCFYESKGDWHIWDWFYTKKEWREAQLKEILTT